jgi:F-type H+-transporting ATPase subunit b
MDARENNIKDKILNADKNLKESENLKESYIKKLEALEFKKQEILNKSHESAQREYELIINQANKFAKQIKKRAQEEILLERKKINSQIKNQIINISWVIASDFLENNLDEQTQKKFCAQAENFLKHAKK